MPRPMTIKQKVLQYVARHPGCSVAEVCDTVAPKRRALVKTAIGISWMEGNLKAEGQSEERHPMLFGELICLRNTAPQPV